MMTLQDVNAGESSSENPPLRLFVLICLIAGIALRIGVFLTCRSLWLDEAMLAVHLQERGFVGLFSPLDDAFNPQAAPILFLLLTKALTSILGFHELVLRLIPLLASLAALLVFVHLVKKSLSPFFCALAVFIFSFHPQLVYFAQEFKPYALDVLATVLLSALTLQMLEKEKPSRTDIGLLCACGGIALFLSFTAIFVLAAIGVLVLWRKARGKLQLSWIQIMWVALTWIGLFALHYWFLIRPSASDAFLKAYWSANYLKLPLSSSAFNASLGGVAGLLLYNGYLSPWYLLLFVLMAVAMADCLWGKCSNAIALMVLILLTTVLASVMRQYPFIDRLLLFLTPCLVLLIVRGAQVLSENRHRSIALIFSVAIAIPTMQSIHEQLTTPMKVEEVRPLVQHLLANMQPEDQIYVYYAAADSVRFYFRRAGVPVERIHFGQVARMDDKQYLREAADLERHSRVWLLFSHVYRDEETRFLENLEGRRIMKREEPGATLYLYQFR